MGSKKSALLECLSDKHIMQSCTSFLRRFSSRLRVGDSEDRDWVEDRVEDSYFKLCLRGEPGEKDNSEDRHSQDLTVNVIYLSFVILVIFL